MSVSAGDIVVADEDGVVVVPAARQEQVLADVRVKLDREAAESLDEWAAAHRVRIDEIVGLEDPSAIG